MLKKRVFIMVICFTMLFASFGFAACPNVAGDWDYTTEWVTYDPAASLYSYETQKGSIHISNQNNCTFYGTVEMISPSYKMIPLTGSIIKPATVRMVTESDTLGFLRAFDSTNGIYTKMVIGSSYHQATSIQGTSSGTAKRRLTPSYVISGKIVFMGGAPLAGVTVTLSGSATKTATTNANGVYIFRGLSSGTYVVTPEEFFYETYNRCFPDPSYREVILMGSDVSQQDFNCLAAG